MADRRVVEAREPFDVATPTGAGLIIREGDRYWSDDPIVKGREHMFRELTVKSSRPAAGTSVGAVETATAAPGERRSVSRPPGRRRAESGEGDA